MSAHAIEWRGGIFRYGGEWFRLANLSGSTLNSRVAWLREQYRTVNPEIPDAWGVHASELSKIGIRCITGLGDKTLTMRYNLPDKSQITLHIVDADYWPQLCTLRGHVIDMIVEMRRRGLDVKLFGWYWADPEKMDAHIPWTLYGICKLLIELIAPIRMLDASVITEIFPVGSRKTYVAHRPGKYESAAYWDISRAYGQVAERIGDVRVMRTAYSATMGYDANGTRLEIMDGLEFIQMDRSREYDYVFEALRSPDLKPLRLHLIGTAMTAINGRRNFVQVCRRLDGVTRDFPVHMRLPYVGRMTYTSMLAVEFIREAVMVQYLLSGSEGLMALTDGIMLSGLRDNQPKLWAELNLEYHLAHMGAAEVNAPNCYRIEDHTTLNYPANQSMYDGHNRRMASSVEDEEIEAPDNRVIAIPLVMGWTSARTAEVFDRVKQGCAMHRLFAGVHEQCPAWMVDRVAERIKSEEEGMAHDYNY